MSKINHIPLILNDLKLHYNFKSNTDFAKFLGIAPQTLSSWYSRCSVDYELLYAKCVGIDANWLLTGAGAMLREEKKEEIISENTISVVDNNSMGFILDRYEALAAENALLKQEVEQLKQSRGKYPDTIPYTDSTQKLSTSLAAEPAHK